MMNRLTSAINNATSKLEKTVGPKGLVYIGVATGLAGSVIIAAAIKKPSIVVESINNYNNVKDA